MSDRDTRIFCFDFTLHILKNGECLFVSAVQIF